VYGCMCNSVQWVEHTVAKKDVLLIMVLIFSSEFCGMHGTQRWFTGFLDHALCNN